MLPDGSGGRQACGQNSMAINMTNESDSLVVYTGTTNIFLRKTGSGPPLLLLHGFPQSHLMWRDIAPILALKFTVICPDLRGYGNSGCPESADDHSPYAKRAMANDMISVMDELGFQRFFIAGHDRGARVAYRLALDHPDKVIKLAILDIIPTLDVWERVDSRFAEAFWPWTLLAQPAPLPERLICSCPEAIVNDALGNWGTPIGTFSPEIIAKYIHVLQNPLNVKAICEEYRAAATLDRQHDLEDRNRARKIQCPVLVLWSAGGALDTWYEEEGGPVGIWQGWAKSVRGYAIEAGHFFPEELPEQTADYLLDFFNQGETP